MPKRPRGERRTADVIGAAIKVARISVGDIEKDREPEKASSAAAELGKLGGAARAKNPDAGAAPGDRDERCG
jgi:hypothetical protein